MSNHSGVFNAQRSREIRNKSGPKIEPCGTPRFVNDGIDLVRLVFEAVFGIFTNVFVINS